MTLRRLRDGDHGHPTGVRCPRPGCGGEVVYNGNYFCEHWAYRGSPPRDLEPYECDWALGPTDDDLLEPGEVVLEEDRRVWSELRRRYRPLIEYLKVHPGGDRP